MIREIKMDEYNESSNYTEYDYDKIPTKRDKLFRALYIIGAALVILTLAGLCIMSKLLLYFAPFVLAFGIYFARFMFRYFQHEYKYTLDRSKFTMVRFYGKSKPKFYFEADVKNAKLIAPYSGDIAKAYPEENFDTVYTSYISKDSPDLYVMIYEKDGKDILAYFEGCKKSIKMMKFYNPNTVENGNLRH